MIVKVVYIFIILSLIVVYSYRQFIHPIRKDKTQLSFFAIGALIKLGGAFALTLLFPKPFGDSYEYFEMTHVFREAFSENFEVAWKLFIQAPENWDWDTRYYGDQFLQHIKLDTDSFFFVKILFLFSLLTGGNYLITSLLFGWVSHLILWKIFRKTHTQINLNKIIWMGIIYIAPSCVFWASGLLKDTFVYWILCLLFLWLLNPNSKQIKQYSLVGLGLVLIFFLKAYLFLSLSFVLLFTLVFQWGLKRLPFSSSKSFILLIGLNLTLVGIISSLIYWLPHHISQYNILGFLTHIYDLENWNTRPGQHTSFHYGDQAWTIGKLIMVSPVALFTGLFRPFIWEAKSFMMVIFSLESLAFLLGSIYFIKRFGRGVISRISQEKQLMFCALMIVFFAYIIGITTFNFGALSRYKTPVFFFVMCFVFYWFRWDRKKV